MKYTFLFLTVIILSTTILFAQETSKMQKENSTKGANGVEAPQAVEGDVVFSDGTNQLLRITDEGTSGAIQFQDGVPTDSDFKLFRNGTDLYFGTNNLSLNSNNNYWDISGNDLYSTTTGNLGIGTTSPSAKIHADGGALFEDGDVGTILNLGAGTRMHWYPIKKAFRAGTANGTDWNDANIGNFSVAFGDRTKATKTGAFAAGSQSLATGLYSVAMGVFANASGNWSTAIGNTVDASGDNSFALGTFVEAGGIHSTAIGSNTEAIGDFSTAIGRYVKVGAAATGTIFIGDNSVSSLNTATTANRFSARFDGGYRFFTKSDLSTGALMNNGANSWSTISDSTKKENFKVVDGEEILNKISKFNLTSWNYKTQDPAQFRHYGPMAQDFYLAFGNDGVGTIGNDTTIASADFDGINLIAIQALEQRTRNQEASIKELHSKIEVLAKQNHELQKLNAEYRNQNSEFRSTNLELRKEIDQIKQVITSISNHNSNISLASSK